MNGHHTMGADPDDYGLPPRTGLEPNGNVVVESYRTDIINGFEKEAPMYNPVSFVCRGFVNCILTLTAFKNNPERTQSSTFVDLKDPIQIHLLTETALSDSKEYEILSQEEIDGIKKQIQTITQLVEVTRSNLLIQSKYRDAAINMAKLYSPTKADTNGQSFGNHRLSSDREAEEEREAIERRCEELAAELFHLEKTLMEPKRRLLEHTAGILQLTHKASRRQAAANGQPPNGVPGSPESLYTYTHGRNSLDAPDEFYTDDTNFYGLEGLDTTTKRGRNPLEIPIKSPIREQQNQLKDELDRAREEKNELMATIAEMERKLSSLNVSIHETVIRFDPEGNSEFNGPPRAADAPGIEPVQMLQSQIEYLESGIVAVQAEQETLLQEPRSKSPIGNVDGTLVELWDMIQSGYTDIKQRKDERRRARAEKGLEDDEDMSDDDGVDLSESYTPLNFSSRVRWLYRQATVLKDQKSVLKRQIKQQRELNNKSDAEKDAELAQKEEELREKDIFIDRAEKDAMDAQKMLSEALEDLEQAREAASSGNSDRTEALEAKLVELQTTLAASEADSENTQQRLAQVDNALNSLYAQLEEATESRMKAEARTDQVQAELNKKREEADSLNASFMNAEARADQVQADFNKKREEADMLNASFINAEARAEQVQADLKKKQEEADALNAALVELKTEVTIARAELDGAYGTRAERAADVAAIRTRSEVETLQSQVDTLKSELSSTVKELEEMTKETIGSEREKVELEGKLDEAVTLQTSLESEMTTIRERLEADVQKARERISQLQEELDGERLRAGRGDPSGRPGAGASMLSEQFRNTMREERKKFQEDIKVRSIIVSIRNSELW